MRYANLRETDLSNTNLKGTNFYQANLSHANFWGANLQGADLRKAILTEADLSQIKSLDSVKIARLDWLSYIKDKLELEGANKIAKDYKVDSVYYFKGSTKKELILLKKGSWGF